MNRPFDLRRAKELVRRGVGASSSFVSKIIRWIGRHSWRATKFGARHTWRGARFAHHHAVARPHAYMDTNWSWYSRWHRWKWHKQAHYSALGVYLLVAMVMLFASFRIALAADLTESWNFSTPGDYTLDSGAEINGTSVRLKAQEYTSDGNTAALFHLNDTSGTTLTDSSSYANNASAFNTPTWSTGQMSGALTLNGTTQYASAPDASYLSLGTQQTIEGWFKPSSTFNTSSNSSQTILDKGSHKVSLDRTTGKLSYEIQNNNNNTWTRQMGAGVNSSWDYGRTEATASTNDGTNYYVGLGNVVGDAEVWRWNGTTWSRLGGDGVNNSWADANYESVTSMAYSSNTLYVGLGTTTGDGEVWSCSTTSNCSTWTKIGGDGLGLTSSTYETVQSMSIVGSTLYIGTGFTAGDADVWRYNGGTSWTQVGGDTLNSSWASATFEAVYSLTTDGTNLYAGLGTTTTEAEVWRYNGTSWTQIGGDGTNSSWNTNYELVQTMTYFGGNLYAGLGSGAGDGEVWRYNGTSWTQIGGDNLNSGWTTSTWIYGMTNDGTNLYAGDQNGYGPVWKWNGTAWTKIGGTGVNNSWSAVQIDRVTGMQFFNSKLYVTPTNTYNFTPMAYTWDDTTWTLIGGESVNGSWAGNYVLAVTSSTVHNNKLYVGLAGFIGSAYVYEWDGTTARIIGGSYGINSGGNWPSRSYEQVLSMVSFKGNLYVGLGADSNDSDVYKWDGTIWTKVGGDGLNGSWNGPQVAGSMTVANGKLYVGTGNGSSNGQVFEYNESSWTKLGGNGLNSSWTSAAVASMTTYNNQVCIGNGMTSTIAQVWCWNGSAWTKIGGDGVNSSWSSATVSKVVSSLGIYNGELIAGVSDGGTLLGEVWKYNGTAWTQIAGGGVNGSWQDGIYASVSSMSVYNGSLYVGLANPNTANSAASDVMRWDGSTWVQVGGDNLNGGWSGTVESITTMSVYKGKLFAGTGVTTNTDALMYSYGNNGYVESTTTSFDSNWRHFAATTDGTTMKLSINGTEEASVSAGGSVVDNDKPLLIGRGYGSKFAGDGTDFFAGQLDEIRVSNTTRTSFNSKPYANTEQGVTLGSAVRLSGIKDWETFTSGETLNGGSVTYRLSDDGGSSWKYWTGSVWGSSSGLTQANTAAVVNTNIATFPVTFSGIKWQAVLKGDGTQQVTLNTVELGANSDSTAPSANASSILASKTNGGASLASNDWTNSSAPYFSWTAGTDAGAGVLGYCLYLGQTSSADPVSTKGLLGTGTQDTGSNCQFAVSGTSLDLATSGLLGSSLTSSNSPYYLNIKAIDRAGNVSATSAQFQFRFDNTPPTNPGFVSAPSGFINTKEATLTWPTGNGQAASDANSGVLGLQYKIGNTTWYGDSHSGTGDINDLLADDGSYTTIDPTDYDNITDGINTVYFRTWDAAGNYTTSTVSAALKVNTTGAPSEPQNVNATPSTNTNNSFAFDWDAPATFNTTTGNADKLSYCYTVNTLPTSNNCTFTAQGVTALSAGAFATQPGTNTFYVVAKDDFNAISYASYSSTTFTANTAAPGMPLNIDVADVSVKATSNWRLAVTWDVPNSVGSGVSAYKVYRSTDNNTFTQVGSSTSTSYVDGGLSQVEYYYKVLACDSANNCGTYSSVVSLTPTGKFTSPANLTSDPVVTEVTTKKATITWSTDRASDSKIAIGTTSGDYSASEIGNSAQVTAHKIELDNLAAGTTYYILAKWTDVDGNTATSQEYAFTTAPAPVLKEVTTLAIGLSGTTLQFTIKGGVKVELQYGQTDSFGGVKVINTSLAESTYTTSLDGLADGSRYLYRLTMYDSEGGKYQSSIFSFTTPLRPRISDLRFQPAEGEPTSTQIVTWKTNVPTTSQVTYGKLAGRQSDVIESAMLTDHSMTIRGLEDSSQYQLIAQGRDAAGNLATSDLQVFKTALDTRPPKITDMVVESTVRGTGSEARGQLVVSWKTDEPASSQVAFGAGSSEQSVQSLTAEDAALTTDHLVIVSDLTAGRPYVVQALSNDLAKNPTKSSAQTVLIGRASDSILSIIFNTLQQMFGFVGN